MGTNSSGNRLQKPAGQAALFIGQAAKVIGVMLLVLFTAPAYAQTAAPPTLPLPPGITLPSPPTNPPPVAALPAVPVPPPVLTESGVAPPASPTAPPPTSGSTAGATPPTSGSTTGATPPSSSALPPVLVCHSSIFDPYASSNYYTSPAESSALAACNDAVTWYNRQWPVFAVNLISCDAASQTMVVGSWFAPPASYYVSCKAQNTCPVHASGTPCACDAGYVFNSTQTACVTLQLSITPSATYIPIESRVQNKQVLTQSTLALNLQKGSEPASRITVKLQASRTAGFGAGQDTINGSTPTDAKGNATADIATRDQPGTTVVMASDTANIQTLTPGVVHWLPADYQSGFLVTCYYVAVEANWPAQSTKNNVCGLPPKQAYRSGFLADTRMQGTGITVGGQYIHYDNKKKCYTPQKCALTASGACATAGTTIAVDPSIIPRGKLGSQVAIDILGGQRTAQDGGGWINLYHIDNFTGSANQACKNFGKQYSKITFLKY